MKIVVEFDVEDPIVGGDIADNHRHIPIMFEEALREYIEKRKDPLAYFKKQCGSKKAYLKVKKENPFEIKYARMKALIAKALNLKTFKVWINP